VIAALIAAAATALAPVHATVLAQTNGNAAVVRIDEIPAMVPALTRRVTFAPAISAGAGVGVDGILDRTTTPWTLRDPVVAGLFAPGLPDPAHVVAVDVGSPIPSADLIDQNGAPVRLDRAFAGKTVLLTFVFTRCPDRTLCPAISGKYAYLQSRLDPAKFALVEITLDPPYDSPEILKRYGEAYGANPAIWHLLTGTGTTVIRLLDAFKIDSLRVSVANFLHSDNLFVITPQGRVAYVVETGGWDPEGVLAEARSVAGMSSNPFERFKLSLIASVVALCGGSQFAGIVLLELALFAVITAIVVASLWMVARVLWHKERA
jgi:protein SCO1